MGLGLGLGLRLGLGFDQSLKHRLEVHTAVVRHVHVGTPRERCPAAGRRGGSRAACCTGACNTGACAAALVSGA